MYFNVRNIVLLYFIIFSFLFLSYYSRKSLLRECLIKFLFYYFLSASSIPIGDSYNGIEGLFLFRQCYIREEKFNFCRILRKRLELELWFKTPVCNYVMRFFARGKFLKGTILLERNACRLWAFFTYLAGYVSFLIFRTMERKCSGGPHIS